jgi:hypothetical protein
MRVKSGARSATGGTSMNAIFKLKRALHPLNRPKAKAYPAGKAIAVDSVADMRVTTKLFHAQRGTGIDRITCT